ncbi:endo alpha-1,4 polygalactosaminidase [Cellulophaga omnivescoria]|uniref:endo alpha-1,4 polygalactosaminidase n=1 Tax=Cellulophaga omnivescoria TaxID=1888890 RepID=UPI003EBB9B0A
MRLINFLYLIVPFVSNINVAQKTVANQSFFICYGKVEPSLIKGYKLVILESAHYNQYEICLFKKNNDKVVAYLSTTEANEYASIFKNVKGTTLGKNSNWNSFYLDLAAKQTIEALHLEINNIKGKGFNGVFLDNLDNTSKWGVLKDYKKPLIDFIKSIKVKHKNFYVVQNAGLFLAKELRQSTDAILMESVYTNYNFKTKEYSFREVKDTKTLLNNIKKVSNSVTKPILLLEYTNTYKMKNDLHKRLKTLNFPFFIANIELQSIPNFFKPQDK